MQSARGSRQVQLASGEERRQSGQKAEASETMSADARIAKRGDLAAFFSTLADSFLNIELET
jgi:hypothetical protein